MSIYFSGCTTPTTPEDVFQNPVDTASSRFVLPRTTITTTQLNGLTITNDSITVTWQGNADAVMFSYKLDNNAWSAWSAGTSALLNYLDEGTHTFTVKSLHRNGTTPETNPPAVTFTVDAVKGQSAMFYPKIMSVSSGSAFSYSVWAEEVNLLYGAQLSIQFNPSIVTIDSIQAGPMMQAGGGSAILLTTINNTSGTVSIDIASVGKKPKGVSGSGVLAILQCHALAKGSADFTYTNSSCSYRDTTNAAITIRSLVSGRVVVK